MTWHFLSFIETRDLGRQVQALLSELETARGGPAAANMFGGLVASSSSLSLASEETQADAIISERLVIFRNIQDLQTQNQQLRRSLRTLSKRFEEMERDRDARMEEESIRQVGEAKKLIEELREQLRLQMLKVETFTRERDQWRRIAEGRGVVGISAPATSATDGIGGSAAVAISPPRVVGSSSGAVAAGGSKSSSSRPVTPSNDLSTSTANGTSLQYQSLYREVQVR